MKGNQAKKKKKSALFYAVTALLTVVIAVGASLPYLLHRGEGVPIRSRREGQYPPNGDGVDQYGRPAVSSDALRGVWIAYLSLDGVNKSKIDSMVSTAKSNGMNTIYFHVRPFGDALYDSDYYPWSHLVTGTQGQAPSDGFDPLAYAVEAAHREGLQLHAWLNPLRIMLNSGSYPPALSDDNPYVVWRGDDNPDNDDWVIDYKKGKYYNPAIPEVRERIVSGVREIVEKYNVDGVHWDDYFYPASDASSAVKKADDTCVFGISPAGNIDNCLSAGADVKTWGSAEGYVDYLVPQIYWTSDNKIAPFEPMCRKWRALVSSDKVKLYIGLALYKAGSDSDGGKWQAADDIIMNQVLFTRGSEIHADGFALYSYAYLDSEQTAEEMKNLRSVLG